MTHHYFFSYVENENYTKNNTKCKKAIYLNSSGHRVEYERGQVDAVEVKPHAVLVANVVELLYVVALADVVRAGVGHQRHRAEAGLDVLFKLSRECAQVLFKYTYICMYIELVHVTPSTHKYIYIYTHDFVQFFVQAVVHADESNAAEWQAELDDNKLYAYNENDTQRQFGCVPFCCCCCCCCYMNCDELTVVEVSVLCGGADVDERLLVDGQVAALLELAELEVEHHVTHAHEALALLLVEEHGRVVEAEEAREPQVDRVVQAHRHVLELLVARSTMHRHQVRGETVRQAHHRVHVAHLERCRLRCLQLGLAGRRDAVALGALGEQAASVVW